MCICRVTGGTDYSEQKPTRSLQGTAAVLDADEFQLRVLSTQTRYSGPKSHTAKKCTPETKGRPKEETLLVIRDTEEKGYFSYV